MRGMVTVSPALPATPTAVGPQIEASFRVWLRQLGATWLLALLPALAALLPTMLLPRPDDPLAAFDALFDWLQRPSTWVMVLLVMGLQVYFFAALFHRMGHLGRGQDPGFAASLAAAAQRLPASLGATVLYSLGLLLSLAPVLGLTALLALEIALPLKLLAGAGALLLLGPPTWLSLAAGLFLFAIMLEGRGALGGLQRSLQLMRGRWWPASAVVGTALLVYSMLAGAIGSVVFMAAFAAQFALGGAESLLGFGWLIAAQWLMAPFSALLQLLVVASLLVVFNDLVLRQASAAGGAASAG